MISGMWLRKLQVYILFYPNTSGLLVVCIYLYLSPDWYYVQAPVDSRYTSSYVTYYQTLLLEIFLSQ